MHYGLYGSSTASYVTVFTYDTIMSAFKGNLNQCRDQCLASIDCSLAYYLNGICYHRQYSLSKGPCGQTGTKGTSLLTVYIGLA